MFRVNCKIMLNFILDIVLDEKTNNLCDNTH